MCRTEANLVHLMFKKKDPNEVKVIVVVNEFLELQPLREEKFFIELEFETISIYKAYIL